MCGPTEELKVGPIMVSERFSCIMSVFIETCDGDPQNASFHFSEGEGEWKGR